jgi:Zn-dependent protease/CBS domain-containing protein
MLKPTITLGRIGGVAVGINWTWLIVFALIVWSLAAGVFPGTNPGLGTGVYVAMAAIASLLFFTSILLHELGHAAQAKRDGMQVEGITLWVFGGVARFSGMFPSAGAEFRIAIAGPLVTAAIAALLLSATALLPLPSSVDGVVAWLGRINVILLAFNMLPAFPLDGGRVLRSLLWRWKGDFAWATHVAGRTGRAFGQLMIAFGVATTLLLAAPGGLWLAVIGWFLVMAAQAETQMLAMREAFADYRVRDIMVTDPLTMPADATLRAVVERTFPPHRYTAYPVVDETGVVAGLLPFHRVATVPEGRWDGLRARDVMVPITQAIVVEGDDGLGDTVAKLLQTDIGRGLVVSSGRFEGFLSITDAQRLLDLKTSPRTRSQSAPNPTR